MTSRDDFRKIGITFLFTQLYYKFILITYALKFHETFIFNEKFIVYNIVWKEVHLKIVFYMIINLVHPL